MKVQFKHLRLTSAARQQQILIAHDITLSDGSDLWLLGGFWNDGPTAVRVHSGNPPFQYHVTDFKPYICTMQPGGRANCKSKGRMKVDDRYSNAFVTMALRMAYGNACGFSSPPGCPVGYRIYWNFRYDPTGSSYYRQVKHGGGWDWIVGYSWTNPTHPYPINVKEAYHGLYSSDTDPGNVVHLHTEDHAYYYTYRAPHPQSLQCPTNLSGCKYGGWKNWDNSPTNVVEWGGFTPYKSGPISVYETQGAGTAYDVCMNQATCWNPPPCNGCLRGATYEYQGCEYRCYRVTHYSCDRQLCLDEGCTDPDNGPLCEHLPHCCYNPNACNLDPYGQTGYIATLRNGGCGDDAELRDVDVGDIFPGDWDDNDRLGFDPADDPCELDFAYWIDLLNEPDHDDYYWGWFEGGH